MAKPCAGYSSVTEAILALHQQGMTVKQIATALGRSRPHIHNTLREKGENPNVVTPESGPFDVALEALWPHARERNMDAFSLAAEIIVVVVRDNMIDAVLDDKGEPS